MQVSTNPKGRPTHGSLTRNVRKVCAAIDTGCNILVRTVWSGLKQSSQRIVSIVSTVEQPLVDQTAPVFHLAFPVQGVGVDGTSRTTRVPPAPLAHHILRFVMMVSTAPGVRHAGQWKLPLSTTSDLR